MDPTKYMETFVIPRAQNYMGKGDFRSALQSIIDDMHLNQYTGDYIEDPMILMIFLTKKLYQSRNALIEFVNEIPYVINKLE